MQLKEINIKKQYIIRLNRGEKIIESLSIFCKKNNIKGGYFIGIGACDELEIAVYDVSKKQYFNKKYKEALEITNLTGTIGLFNKELIIHTHITCGNSKLNAIGGHLIEAKISGTAEIIVYKSNNLSKEIDPETNLKVFSLK